MIELFKLLVVVGGVIAMTFLILVALPQCKLRQMVMPFVAWAFVALCAAYAISPVDIVPEVIFGPFGLIDDLGAVVLGVGSAMTALSNAKARKQYPSPRDDPYFNR